MPETVTLGPHWDGLGLLTHTSLIPGNDWSALQVGHSVLKDPPRISLRNDRVWGFGSTAGSSLNSGLCDHKPYFIIIYVLDVFTSIASDWWKYYMKVIFCAFPPNLVITAVVGTLCHENLQMLQISTLLIVSLLFGLKVVEKTLIMLIQVSRLHHRKLRKYPFSVWIYYLVQWVSCSSHQWEREAPRCASLLFHFHLTY